MADVWLTLTYFDWLRSDCMPDQPTRMEYDGALRCLHEIPFYWTIPSDENRAGDALAFRQSEFLGFQHNLEHIDQHWLYSWAHSTPSVLEVMLGIARRWTFYFEEPSWFFFRHLFVNLGLDRFPGASLSTGSLNEIQHTVNVWMSRSFSDDGIGSPFPIKSRLDRVDMRTLDIWSQMNAYSAEHFQ